MSPHHALTHKSSSAHLAHWARFGAIAITTGVAAWPSLAAPAATSSPRIECATLLGKTVSAHRIGLPTAGATVTSAVVVASTPEVVGASSVTHALPEYCKVLGTIHPIDPLAPPILFQVNVPTQWNLKTIHVGGGGLNGRIPANLAVISTSGSPVSGANPPDAEYPLSRGYAMFGGDSGHQDTSNNATWALNDEAWENFGHAALKKTHDAAHAIILALHGRKPRVSYFMGSSQGGREALEVAQRYPEDYDGVVATSPLIGYTSHVVHKTLLATVQTGAAWIPPSKVAAVGAEVLRQCDALDGLTDGVISNYMACDARFDPARVPEPFQFIRCEGGADTGSACLSDAQISTLNQMHAPTDFGAPMAHGWRSFPGYGTGRESFSSWLSIDPQPNPSMPPALGQPGATLSFGILKDPAFNLVNFTIEPFIGRLQAASAIIDSSNPDLGKFFARGGKMILKTHSSDYSSNPRTIMTYYDTLVSRFGQRRVDRHVRLYVMPNGNHGGSGASMTTGEPIPQFIDMIQMASDWVEGRVAPPDSPVLTNMSPVPPYTVAASKPMCRYPLYPQFVGGDAKNADSYRCTRAERSR